MTFDTNYLIYSGADYTPSSAWVNLFACTMIIAVACYVLAESVMLSARALGVAPYFTAVILGAAASSVPDVTSHAICRKLRCLRVLEPLL